MDKPKNKLKRCRSSSVESNSSSSSSSSDSSSSSGSSEEDIELPEHDSELDKKELELIESDEENQIDKDSLNENASEDEDCESVNADVISILEELRGPPDGAENKISNKHLRNIVSVMSAWWNAQPPPNVSYLAHAASRFGCCSDGSSVTEKRRQKTLTSMDLRYVYNKEMFKRIRVDAMLRQRGFLEPAGKNESGAMEDLSGVGYSQDLGKIQECVSRGYQLLLSEINFRKSLDKSVDQGCPILVDPFYYVPYTQGKLDEFQSFVIFLLRQLHDLSYRRYNEAVYEQIISPLVEGHDGKAGRFATHAWKRVGEIKDFVLNQCNKNSTFEQWQASLKNNSLERVIKYLMHCPDVEFTQLYPNRMWHAFNNGLYYVDKQEFYRFGDPRIPSNMVCCTYHDQIFKEKEILEDFSWQDLEVPHLQKVLEYQFAVDGKEEGIVDKQAQKKIILWIYAFLGRLLHEVGAKDKWQVIPFFVGRAGTGKSLLLKSVGKFYNAEDVEILANNSQRGFGLETLIDKLVWMCMEVKHDFTLDQAQLQSMVSGEPVSIMRKNKAALSLVWKVPGIMAGNEVANWTNNSGSMDRRVILIFFDRKVESGMVDPYLDNKIQQEIGFFLHKCACSYAAACNSYGDKDIWSSIKEKDDMGRETGKKIAIIPRIFHVAKQRFQISTDPLMSFLSNEKQSIMLSADMTQGMTFERFKAAASNYFVKEGFKGFQWKETKYKAVFEDQGIKKIKIDAHFLESKGQDPKGNYVDMNGDQHPLGTEWLIGVHEPREIKKSSRGDLE